MPNKKNKYQATSFDHFRSLATDSTLSKYEKIGFPDAYRAGYEESIFSDIRFKTSNLELPGSIILDIGPGCSGLSELIISHSRNLQHKLHLVDSAEMLSNISDESFIKKINGIFPECMRSMADLVGKVDVIVCYSVFHYVLIDVPIFRFLDSALSLLAPGGQFLIGDIPNISKRKRFFSSEAGSKYHKQFMNTQEPPIVEFNKIENDQIDDAIIFSILHRSRDQGFDAYLLPQPLCLPMSNRREDILIVRP